MTELNELDRLKKVNAELLAACKRDRILADVAILSTPIGDARNELTDVNILRLQAIVNAEGGG